MFEAFVLFVLFGLISLLFQPVRDRLQGLVARGYRRYLPKLASAQPGGIITWSNDRLASEGRELAEALHGLVADHFEEDGKLRDWRRLPDLSKEQMEALRQRERGDGDRLHGRLMERYGKEFSGRTLAVYQEMARRGFADPKGAILVGHPTNALGIRMVANGLGAIAETMDGKGRSPL